MKKHILLILIFAYLQGCGSASKGFKLKKDNTGDEFLVEKKNPLVLPPNFNELPEPGKTEISDKSNKSFEEKILSKDTKNNSQKDKTSTKSTEELILKNIKKNDTN